MKYRECNKGSIIHEVFKTLGTFLTRGVSVESRLSLGFEINPMIIILAPMINPMITPFSLSPFIPGNIRHIISLLNPPVWNPNPPDPPVDGNS